MKTFNEGISFHIYFNLCILMMKFCVYFCVLVRHEATQRWMCPFSLLVYCVSFLARLQMLPPPAHQRAESGWTHMWSNHPLRMWWLNTRRRECTGPVGQRGSVGAVCWIAEESRIVVRRRHQYFLPSGGRRAFCLVVDFNHLIAYCHFLSLPLLL